MSDVNPTMKFVDHKSPSSISIDNLQLQGMNHDGLMHMMDEFLAREQTLKAMLLEILDKPMPNPVINVTSPAITMPDRVEMQAPVLHANLPPLDIPAPQVHVSVNLFSPKVAGIIVGMMILQSILVGVAVWL